MVIGSVFGLCWSSYHHNPKSVIYSTRPNKLIMRGIFVMALSDWRRASLGVYRIFQLNILSRNEIKWPRDEAEEEKEEWIYLKLILLSLLHVLDFLFFWRGLIRFFMKAIYEKWCIISCSFGHFYFYVHRRKEKMTIRIYIKINVVDPCVYTYICTVV